ncbi:MAG: hypothetical protein WCZ28_03315 [Burkholderiaceae bacterium]
MIRGLIISLLVGALTACSGPGAVRIDVPATPGAMFDFQDMRPAEQRSDRGRFDTSGDRITLGERDLEPPPAVLFRSWFARKLPPSFAGRTVVLESFVVMVPAAIAERPSPVEVRIAGSVGGARFAAQATSDIGNTTRADINATIVEALNTSIREATILLEQAD